MNKLKLNWKLSTNSLFMAVLHTVNIIKARRNYLNISSVPLETFWKNSSQSITCTSSFIKLILLSVSVGEYCASSICRHVMFHV